jgi:hypothetical protein
MSEEKTKTQENQSEIQLEEGTYEIIRNRLLKQGEELRRRIDLLNSARKKVFGSIETRLLSSNRITTENNCVATDIVPVGENLIFGYNVTMGLKSKLSIADVFSIYSYTDQKFTGQTIDLINDAKFIEDFQNLYEYYKNTRFVKFGVIGPHLFMVFQSGSDINDIKAFKWLVKDEKLVYKGNRSTHEFVFPEQHEFKWIKATRDSYNMGLHPHVSIEDIVFVETVGGDLTIKVENNTESGLGIYAEDVDNPNQTLDDAEIYYAIIGNIVVLKILPYQEKDYRYIVYNSKVQEAIRIDALEDSCVLLPDGQGLIFSNGYYLQTGQYKLFDNDIDNLLFESKQASVNGEDYLYVFYNKELGEYVLLIYNVIEQKIDTPILCHGFSIFENGELCYFKGDKEEKRHHAVQVWQTPFMSSDMQAQTDDGSFLFKIGNKDIVKAMAECSELILLINKEDTYANLYIDLVKRSTDIIDSYYWLSNNETHDLLAPLKEIKGSATTAINEYEKVTSIRKETNTRVASAQEKVNEIFRHITKQKFDNIDRYVNVLADLRNVRGEIISLKELRYIDLALIDELEQSVATKTLKQSQDCVNFLLREDSLNSYKVRVDEIQASVEKVTKVKDADDIAEQILDVSTQLEMLIDIVGNLKIEDATQTTQIINNISSIYSGFNRIKAELKKRRKGLHIVEAKAEFNSQIKLVGQGIINYLDLCDTPAKTDEYLTKLMVQLEEIEGKFSDFEEFIDKIAQKREEVYNAFESKKVSLLEARNRRATAMVSSADRILKAIHNRVSKFNDVSEVNGYFASDLMIEKVRDVIAELKELEENVKADDLQSKLKTIRDESVRQIRDRKDLFEAGGNTIKLGNHHFLVNVQALELSMVNKGNSMFYHLAGTNFFEEVRDEAFLETRHVWNQHLVSETNKVYRAEYLAYLIYQFSKNRATAETPSLEDMLKFTDEELLQYIRKFMGARYNEGYSKGIHDEDAMLILKALLQVHSEADLLTYNASARACAEFFWKYHLSKEEQTEINLNLKGAGAVLSAFPNTSQFSVIIGKLQSKITGFVLETNLFDESVVSESANYLFEEIARGDSFILSREGKKLFGDFNNYLKKNRILGKYENSVKPLLSKPGLAYNLIKNWVKAFIASGEEQGVSDFIDEAVICLLGGPIEEKKSIDKTVNLELLNMKGSHPLLEENKYSFNYNSFCSGLKKFCEVTVPQYEDYTRLKKNILEKATHHLRLNEFKPRVLSSFVRNKLIDKVYLPLIGNNLAKQIGAEGEGKRTDLMGMLLLISPPGYGKTTLMEYLANRLGIVFMKINGPSIGNSVTSLDPGEARNAAAREELEKLNLAFEMGDNVMIYLDDIQHCNPEFLQKFISLCDAQRKIEGVYKGRSKTYDFRGKKVCVVMAGNPYTESGEKFKIPDMLANRADIYNIGDIIGDSDEEFKLSYIENSLTSNPVLGKIASKSQNDLYTLIKMAVTGKKDGLDFESNHSPEEISEYVNVLKKMITVRDIILKVNTEYIASAGQADAYRTEPPFKLQGSYRDMNKIAEKILSVMNDKEVETVILSHYQNEAQTLTTGAEANMLKFKEMYGVISEEEKARWEEVKVTFRRNNKIKGMGSDQQVANVILQMEEIAKGLLGIKDVLGK